VNAEFRAAQAPGNGEPIGRHLLSAGGESPRDRGVARQREPVS